MKLSFNARREHRVKIRAAKHGGQNRYVGVEWDAENKCEVPTAEPFTVDPARSPTSKAMADRLLKCMRSRNGRKDPPLWPADEATAVACGRPYIETKKDTDGWHVPKAAVEIAEVEPGNRVLVPAKQKAARSSAPAAPATPRAE